MGSETTAADKTASPSPGAPGCDGARRPGVIRRAVRLGIIAALTFTGVCIILWGFQTRLIYFPSRGYDATPGDVGLRFEDLTLTTSDGVAISAWYIPHDRPRGSVIFCHGNAGNMADRLHDVKLLHAMGVNVLIFDYRGYGTSEGKPGEQGTYEDAVAAWDHLVDTRGELPERIALFGRSLGGGVAIELARRRSPGALIVESTFTNLVDVGRIHYPFLPVRWILTHRYESIDKIGAIACPKLFFHGTGDTLIPIDLARKLFAAAAEPKEFVETPGGHNDAGFTYSPKYTDRLAAFLSSVLPK